MRSSPTRKKTPSPAGYSGTPLPKKLGIKENAVVGLIAAPGGFEQTLGELPTGAKIVRDPRKRCDIVLCFVESTKALNARMRGAMKLSADTGLWMIWPKKTGSIASDLSEGTVRKTGLAARWVDYKICAVDADWSGLKFARRDRAKAR